MTKKYFAYHVHTELSNGTAIVDSISTVEDYVKKAEMCGMTALGITEHGNTFHWKDKKDTINKAGLKYVHGVECYVTVDKDAKVRDNFHMVLLAKNKDGAREINKLTSSSFGREDNHFYYVPRITLEQVLNTSDNVIITTACLGGMLSLETYKQVHYSGRYREFFQFLIDNKHRCFLEVQHHEDKWQKEYNQKLWELSKLTGLRLVAGTDTHSVDESHADGRAMLQRAKNIRFDNENSWDLVFKTYDELVKAYEKQDSLPREVYLQAIENTNVIEESIEDFEFDYSQKYPQLYDNPNEVFINRIMEGLEYRGVDSNSPVVKERITREVSAFNETNSINYMLLEDVIKTYCREVGIPYGYGRGSVSGSYVAYLMQITEMDSIRENLIFERFINKDRISIADIDTDYPSSQRAKVKEFLHNLDGVYCADIVTFNTIALKGAIREIGRALGDTYLTYDEINQISKNCDNEDMLEKYREQYPRLFHYVDLVEGTIISVGSHPAGTVVSPFPLDDSIGLCTTKTNPFPVTCLNMHEIDSLNFVKLDLLVLDTMEVIYKTCEMAGIPMVTPDSLDTSDMEVWSSIRKDSTGIFQWESADAHAYYRQLFSSETIAEIKKVNPNVDLIDLFSIGNGAIRPSGESYREDLAKGKFNYNGHHSLDELLKSTHGYLVYQEQIMEFLNKFCGFSLSESDSVRRGLSKKEGTEQFIPAITEGFLKTMEEKYNMDNGASTEVLDHFLQVILDASNYGFSVNHSQSYSYIGFACAYLRHYYPLEFLASSLEVQEGNVDKTSAITNYMFDYTDVKLKPARFRYSNSDYSIDRDTNSIFKGMKSIKFLNEKVSNELYELRDNEYETFVDLLIDITENTGCNKRQTSILIGLGFFEEFGGIGKLQNIYREFSEGKNKYLKTYVDKTKAKRREKLIEFELAEPNLSVPIVESIIHQVEYMGYTDLVDKTMKPSLALITKHETNQWGTHFLTLYRICDGTVENVKVYSGVYNSNKVDALDLICTGKVQKKPKWNNPDELEDILVRYQKVVL